MEIIEAYATQNKCYQIGTPLKPRGIMLHSIGCPQPNAAVMAHRYNTYQPDGQSVCVHGFVQRDGTYYHTLPYNLRAWHCGGSANQTHIGIEMTEPVCAAVRAVRARPAGRWRHHQPRRGRGARSGQSPRRPYASVAGLWADDGRISCRRRRGDGRKKYSRGGRRYDQIPQHRRDAELLP